MLGLELELQGLVRGGLLMGVVVLKRCDFWLAGEVAVVAVVSRRGSPRLNQRDDPNLHASTTSVQQVLRSHHGLCAGRRWNRSGGDPGGG